MGANIHGLLIHTCNNIQWVGLVWELDCRIQQVGPRGLFWVLMGWSCWNPIRCLYSQGAYSLWGPIILYTQYRWISLHIKSMDFGLQTQLHMYFTETLQLTLQVCLLHLLCCSLPSPPTTVQPPQQLRYMLPSRAGVTG